ncbi:hypothetical protein NFI96_020315, partial [Prochilodus magdalenae]
SVMKSCSSTPRIPILLIITLTSRSESAVHPVKVKLNDCATLPCSESCSGPVRWTMFSKSSSVVAQCDRTSCRSLMEGYEMNPDPYLKSNFSLIITTADFSKRARYTCDCDETRICDFHLQIEPLSVPLQVKTGDSLMLKLDISDTVEVIYDGTDPDGPSTGRICTVDGRSPHCNAEYTQRASLSSYLELRGMTPSESGTYSVVDTANAEVIHKYEVTVEDLQRAVVSSMSHPVSAAPSSDGCTTQDYMHTDRYHDCP